MLTILQEEDTARRHLTTYQDGFEVRILQMDHQPGADDRVAWCVTDAEGTVLASGHLEAPDDGAFPLERLNDQVRAGMLPVQVWQPRTKEFQLQALTHWRAGLPPFPEAHRLVATLDVPEPEAAFGICQHFTEEGWLRDPRVRARASSAHSMCVGDVVVTSDGQAWRVLGCGWEELPRA
ncbi:hypothetical protein [Deinococcus sp. DB0503]|uniref:hypothetical protein n=1 Tax=Deinococcus sp. DB0503 TaxID=2479203 RepID=UPI0018DFAB67|nr:hypothetical protein [Deinococcus sp. DB0503]MBI0446876.1 hypothetical protein [Deinococcus sp. DB0503]